MIALPEVSIVCPLYNEQDNVRPLVAAVRAALKSFRPWELILIDDGSRDGTADAIRGEMSDSRVRFLRLARNYGQSTATRAGLDAAKGRVVVTMDGDLQNDPIDIPRLIAKLEEGYDMVIGYREHRQDRTLSRKIPSAVANRIIRSLTGVPIRDSGCSLKAYRKALSDQLRLYSDMHRFIPAIAVGSAGARIAQIPVRHHPRRFGESKYGLSRVWKVLTDLLTVTMLRWFQERPLMMFAYGAIASLVASMLFLVWKLLAGSGGVVLPGAAFLFLGLAIYLVMVGLIAQVALHRWSLSGDGAAYPMDSR